MSIVLSVKDKEDMCKVDKIRILALGLAINCFIEKEWMLYEILVKVDR